MTTEEQYAGTASAREGYQVIFEFQWKSLTESVQLVTKAVGIYFFLLLAVIGAIYNSKIAGIELQIIVGTIIIISIIFAPMILFLAWGIIKGLNDLEVALQRICPLEFDAIGMKEYFRRGRLAARVATGCAIIILIIIIAAVALIQYR